MVFRHYTLVDVCRSGNHTYYCESDCFGKLVDYFHPQVLLRAFTIIQIIGVVIVSLTLINHWHFALLVIGFIVLVAPVTGVATLGFSIAMEERTTGSGIKFIGIITIFIRWPCDTTC